MRIAGRSLRGTCVVLCYHEVTAEERYKFAQQLDVLLRYAKPIRADTNGCLEKAVRHAAILFHDGYRNVIENALPELARRRIPTTLFIPTRYVGEFPGWIDDEGHRNAREVIVTADELKSLDQDLVSFASHSRTHPNLLLLTEEEAREELVKSKLELEEMIGRPVTLFGFPYGAHDGAVVEWCKEAGYQRVFTIEPKLAFSEPGEYVTGSVNVSPMDWMLEFKLKLLGAYRWLPSAFVLKRKIRLFLPMCFRSSTESESLQGGVAPRSKS